MGPKWTRLLILVVLAALMSPAPADAQILRRLGQAARSAAESEITAKIDRLMRDAVRCVLGDSDCFQKAQDEGKEVIFTDASGEIITDEDGVPITDRAAAAEAAGEPLPDEGPALERPGEGVWANYDFVPGDRVLFYDDYSNDRVGDFPRRMEFVTGLWEVVDWEGRRLLRNTGPRHAALKIMLPETLPEHFTIEFDAYLPHTNYVFVVAPSPPVGRNTSAGLVGHYFQVGVAPGTGVTTRDNQGSRSVIRTNQLTEGLVPVRILADGRYARVYVGETRVANIPNADLERSDEIWIENTYAASNEQPIYLGPIRVAAGGTDLYQRLADEGRVATQGILFAVNSAEIRPESTPTLLEIGRMLSEHEDLRLRIEGHTDSTGDDASNLALSQERAEAVRAFLMERHGIDGARLEAEGLGETQPAADNETPEGRQNNRRVVLVRLEG